MLQLGSSGAVREPGEVGQEGGAQQGAAACAPQGQTMPLTARPKLQPA